MRYYQIDIAASQGSAPLSYSSITTSPDGVKVNNPNALQVKFSIDKMAAADSGTNSYVQILGVPLSVLKAASNYNGASITIQGGFWPGLPLANIQSTRNKLLTQSSVWACFGNWRGNDVTLDLLLSPGDINSGNSSNPTANNLSTPSLGGAFGSPTQNTSRLMSRRRPSAYAPRVQPLDDSGGDTGGSLGSALGGLGDIAGDILSAGMQLLASTFGGGGFRMNPVNLIHNALPNMPFTAAFQQTMSIAFPGKTINAWFNSALMLPYKDSGFYQNLQQYASYLKSISMQKLGGRGIDIFTHLDAITATDWSMNLPNVKILYSDLIGQPTWINIGEIQFDVVMNGDLVPPCIVSLPATVFSTTADDSTRDVKSMMIQNLTFTGSFYLHRVRHVGDSRSRDGKDWRTSCWAYAPNSLISTFGPAGAAIASGVQTIEEATQAPSPNLSINLMKRRARVW